MVKEYIIINLGKLRDKRTHFYKSGKIAAIQENTFMNLGKMQGTRSHL